MTRRVFVVQTGGAADAALCGNCKKGPSETGACPFQSEINGDDSECELECCDNCRGGCADNI